jgi:hypothetical protein
MKRTIYKTNWKRIASKGFLPLLPFLAQVGFNIFFFLDGKLNMWEVIYVNLLWGILISFPGLLIFINYLSNSLNTIVILEYNKIRLQNGDAFIELDNPEIDKIEIHTIRAHNRFPWGFFNYYVLREGDKEIAFNNFTIDIGDFWQDSLSRRIKNENIEFKYSWYPWMKKSLTKPKLH